MGKNKYRIIEIKIVFIYKMFVMIRLLILEF